MSFSGGGKMSVTKRVRKLSFCGILILVGISVLGLLRSNMLPADFLAQLQSDTIFYPSGTVTNNTNSNIQLGSTDGIRTNYNLPIAPIPFKNATTFIDLSEAAESKQHDATLSATNNGSSSTFSWSDNMTYVSFASKDESYSEIESNPFNSTLSPGNELSETFLSACLLIKDDNDILNEWIAYHYHLWRLRRIVVAVDPTSQTSPREILQKWKTVFQDTNDTYYQHNFNFEIWEKDSQYLPNWFLKDPSKVPQRMGKLQEKHPDHKFTSDEILQISIHRFRQREFLRKCLLHFDDRRKKTHLSNGSVSPTSSYWVMHIDTDEYMVLNPWLRRRGNNTSNTTDANWPNRRLSDGALFKLLMEQISNPQYRNEKKGIYPCLSMPRLLFGGVEQNMPMVSEVPINHGVRVDNNFTGFWNLKAFESMRWKYHAPMITAGPLNGQPKVLLDLQGLAQQPKNQQFLHDTIHSIHRPSPAICPKKVPFDGGANPESSLSSSSSNKPPMFAIHHYLGSQERFLARKDPRRSIQGYLAKANQTEGPQDDWSDSWLQEFVQQHGLKKVLEVLGDYRRRGSM